MAEKLVTKSFTIPRELKTLLEKWAVEDDRPVSSILRSLIKYEAQRRAQQNKEQTVQIKH